MSYKLNPTPNGNYLASHSDSMKLVKTIENYWHSRGHMKVKAWVEKQILSNYTRPIYIIRSNLSYTIPIS